MNGSKVGSVSGRICFLVAVCGGHQHSYSAASAVLFSHRLGAANIETGVFGQQDIVGFANRVVSRGASVLTWC